MKTEVIKPTKWHWPEKLKQSTELVMFTKKVTLSDLNEKRKKTLDELTKLSQELGLYD